MRIRNKEMLTNHGNIEGRRIVTELLDAGLDALDPYLRVREFVKLENNRIILDDRGYEMKGDPHAGPAIYDLKDYDRVFVIGAAKGIQRAALAMEEVLGDVLTAGHVIGKHGEEILCKKIGVTLAGHPVPDKCCVEGCKKIEALAKDITERDLVFIITGSGCGSLMTYPSEGISIEDISAFTHMMQIEKGVPTSDLNQIRTHIDRFKGGRLARLFAPAAQVHMTTADPSKMNTPVMRMTYFEMLGINTFFPQVATASTYKDCIAIIRKWDAWDRTPESIREHLLAGGPHNENMGIEEYETLHARFFGLIFKDSTVYPAVRKKAQELGYRCIMLSEYMQAEAREAGFVNSSMALCSQRMGEPFEVPVVLMTSGENVVTVGKEPGVGGRNQEYCTAAAINIQGNKKIVFGAVDTDGTDGPGGFIYPGAPECLAGAVVDGDTFEEATKAGIDMWEMLKTHGTSEGLWRLGCGVDAVSSVSALDLGIILIMK
ncbi:MAG: DUF4147 domain-containing protein [Blautia sp.]|nr:DUF4147 domain-containing protein [Blautia sp.]